MPWTILAAAAAALVALNVLLVLMIGAASHLRERKGQFPEGYELGAQRPEGGVALSSDSPE